MARRLVDPAVAAAGDIDSCMVLLRTASGTHGAYQQLPPRHLRLRPADRGAWQPRPADRRQPSCRPRSSWPTRRPVAGEKPLHFFLERYAEAYRASNSPPSSTRCAKGTPMPVGAADGRQALVLAEAALRSLRESRPVAPTRSHDRAAGRSRCAGRVRARHRRHAGYRRRHRARRAPRPVPPASASPAATRRAMAGRRRRASGSAPRRASSPPTSPMPPPPRAIVEQAEAALGPVDGLVNAAGLTDRGTIDDTSSNCGTGCSRSTSARPSS